MFNLKANSVDDQCLGGAANVVAIPAGDETRDFQNPLEFPGSADSLPFTTTLKLVAPFTEVTTKFTKVDGAYVWANEPMNIAVDLGGLDDMWAGCLADFAFGTTWTPEEAAGGGVKFSGKMFFRVTGTNDGDTCPIEEDTALPCTVELGAIATRVE